MSQKNIPQRQRALILQGGAALGAYEAGVYKVLYNWIRKDNPTEDQHLFDIIAGTSIGAIDAAIIVNHVKERLTNGMSKKQSWEGTVEKLENFWKDTMTFTMVENPFFSSWWNLTYGLIPTRASSEAARRYYSVLELLRRGARNVYFPLSNRPDLKFFNPTTQNTCMTIHL